MNRRTALRLLPILALLLFCGANRQERYRREILDGQTRSGIVTCDSYQRGGSLGSTDNLPYRPGRPGLAYTAVAGTWATTGNVLTPTGSSPGGNGWYASVDPGVSLCVVEQTLSAISGSSSGPCFRYTDASNHYQLAVSTSTITLYEVVSGVFTARGTAATGTFAAGDTLVTTVNGSTISWAVVRAGAVISTGGTYGSASQHTNATAIGWRATSASSKYGNMSVRRAA